MRSRILPAVLLLASVAVLSSCLFAPPSITIEDNESIKIGRVGDRITVRLQANPSTGYGWVRVEPADFSGAALEPIEEGTWLQPSDCSPLPGAPADVQFRYRAVAPGTVVLAYEYRPAWETEPIETFFVVIWVRE
jgi:inhibitor of cysteine peptidase